MTKGEGVLPKKICLAPSCSNLIGMKEKYCSSCQPVMKEVKRDKNRKYDQYVREDEIVKFYHSREWKRVREIVLIRDNYLCQHCLKENNIKAAEIVHHMVEIKTDWSKRLIIKNMVSLCNSCHNQLHN